MHAILVASFVVCLFLSSTAVSDSFSTTDFAYFRNLTISDPHPYFPQEILVTLDSDELITQAKLRSDCSDLRFFGWEHSSPPVHPGNLSLVGFPLLFWIESGCGMTEMAVWVSVRPGEKFFGMYYGFLWENENENGAEVRVVESGSVEYSHPVFVFRTDDCGGEEGWYDVTSANFPELLNGILRVSQSNWGDAECGDDDTCHGQDHRHTSMSLSFTTPNYPSWKSFSIHPTSGARATSYVHLHTISMGSLSCATSTMLPRHVMMRLCYAYSPRRLLANSLLPMFTRESVMYPWSDYSVSVEFVKVADDISPLFGVDGSNVHNHWCSASNTYQTTDISNEGCVFSGSGDVASDIHGHAVSSVQMSGRTVIPPYVSTRFVVNDSPSGFFPGATIVAPARPPLGWEAVGDYDGLLMRAGSAGMAGYTSGNFYHTHAVSAFTGNQALGPLCLLHYGFPFFDTELGLSHHGHSAAGSTSGKSSVQAVDVLLFRRKESSPIQISSEIVNAVRCYGLLYFDENACNGDAGECVEFDTCECSEPWYGRDCAEAISTASYLDVSTISVLYSIDFSVIAEIVDQESDSLRFSCSQCLRGWNGALRTAAFIDSHLSCEWITDQRSVFIVEKLRISLLDEDFETLSTILLSPVTRKLEVQVISLDVVPPVLSSSAWKVVVPLLLVAIFLCFVVGAVSFVAIICAIRCRAQRDRITRIQNLGDYSLLIVCPFSFFHFHYVQKDQELSSSSAMARVKLDESLFQISLDDVKLEKKIATGNFAAIYRCRWFGHSTCLKLYDLSRFRGERLAEVCKNFERELSILISLPPHPNAIGFHGAVLARPRIAILLPFASRGNVREYLRSATVPVSFSERVRFALEAARGIAHLHRNQVIHRDLKWENILLNDKLTACVSDFGLSRKVFSDSNSRSELTQGIGTTALMAPEILRVDLEESYSYPVDVYSFGIMLYQIATLRFKPYGEVDPVRVAFLVRNQRNFRPMWPRDQSVPSWIRTLARACWNYDPKERPLFRDLVHRLEKCFENEDSGAGSPILVYVRLFDQEDWESEDVFLKERTLRGLVSAIQDQTDFDVAGGITVWSKHVEEGSAHLWRLVANDDDVLSLPDEVLLKIDVPSPSEDTADSIDRLIQEEIETRGKLQRALSHLQARNDSSDVAWCEETEEKGGENRENDSLLKDQ